MPSIWLNHLLRHLKPQQQCHLPHRGGHGGTRGRVEAHHAGLNTVTTVTARHVIQQSLAATLMGSSDLTPLHSNTNDLAEAGGKLVEQAVQCRRSSPKHWNQIWPNGNPLFNNCQNRQNATFSRSLSSAAEKPVP